MSLDDAAQGAAEEKGASKNVIRRMYDWVIGWADSPYGLWALFFIAFIESPVFLIPPDVLLLALAFGAPKKSFKFAIVCAVGSVLGAVGGYFIGQFFYDSIGIWVVETYGLSAKMKVVEKLYNDNAFMALLAAGFTPIPFKVFTIASGMMKIPLSTLVLASAISRTGRFMLVAAFVFFLGEKARVYIEKYFELLTIVFTIALIGGFVLLKYVF
ncbi:MAG TPA: DedA family protein [Phycisphaerales bacterium]|nr:DedA family protein [Phycisphaerales bacterium]